MVIMRSILRVAPLCALALAVAATPAGAHSVRTDGAQLIHSTTGSVSAQNPAFSPNGGTLIFTQYTDGYDGSTGGALKMPAAGGVASPLWNKSAATNVNGLASWNGSTNRVAFAVSVGNGNIATVAATGAPNTYKQITNAPSNKSYLEPTYSANGGVIAFENDVPNAQSDDGTVGSINLVSASGGTVTPLVARGDNRLPVYSPDGKLILFQRRTDLTGDYHLFTIDPVTKAMTQITGLPGTVTAGDNCDSDAAWSPGGKWILVSACYGGLMKDNIFLISPDGKKLVRMTNQQTAEDGAPAMSPDGKWVYFESHRQFADTSPSQLWRIPTPPLPP
jgi:TolB protein